MKANPGDMILLEQVVGRNALITRLWGVLEQRSLELLAERRLGKTTVIKKMQAEAPEKKVSFLPRFRRGTYAP